MTTHATQAPSPPKSAWRRLQQRAHAILEPAGEGDQASRVFDVFLLTLISLNVLAVVIETVEPIGSRYGAFFRAFEMFSVSVFVIEYVLRVWSCRVDARFAQPVTGRLRFATRPMLIVDLLAFLPALLPMLGVDARPLRALRLLRVFRILKLTRYTQSLQLLGAVFRRKASDLVVVTSALGVLLLIASSLMYFAEHQAQPEKFSSIPATMWWGIATLTTVGYGDVYPITLLGRLLGSVVAVLGIGLFALPAGLLAAGFTDELERQRMGPPCSRCGQPIPTDQPPLREQ